MSAQGPRGIQGPPGQTGKPGKRVSELNDPVHSHCSVCVYVCVLTCLCVYCCVRELVRLFVLVVTAQTLRGLFPVQQTIA